MIRILHSVSNMDRAGIETMLMNYYRHIDRNKVQFDFLCNKTKPGAYDEEIKKMGGKIYHTPGLNPIKYRQYLKCMKKIFKNNPEYKIVEAHNGALGVYALHAAKKYKIPIRIFHAHGASITKDWKWPIKRVCKALLPLNMNRHFTCGKAATECYFGEKIVSMNDYEFIPNAINTKKFVFNPSVRERMRKENNLENKNVIGHVGRFMPQKNHNFLIDVFLEYLKIDNNAHLVLLGDGELLDTITRKIKEKGIEEKVTLVGNVSNVNEWYQAFDCFVLPSIWEGLPVVGVEAQAADLPCIFSASITREIGLSSRAKFVSTKNKEQWISEIKKAMEDKKRKDTSELIKNNNYDIEIEAVKLENKYIELAGETK